MVRMTKLQQTSRTSVSSTTPVLQNLHTLKILIKSLS